MSQLTDNVTITNVSKVAMSQYPQPQIKKENKFNFKEVIVSAFDTNKII
jgi:hypothetical protein